MGGWKVSECPGGMCMCVYFMGANDRKQWKERGLPEGREHPNRDIGIY